jgi:hypothetical protein
MGIHNLNTHQGIAHHGTDAVSELDAATE